MNKFVGNAFVYGNSLENYLVAIIIPDFETLVPWAEQQGLDNVSYIAPPPLLLPFLRGSNGDDERIRSLACVAI